MNRTEYWRNWKATFRQTHQDDPVYKTRILWQAMKQRCINPKNTAWPLYGGRGINVCQRWLRFENFVADMGLRPKGLSIERVNNDGNYEPGNCRWATQKEQAQNRRRSPLYKLTQNQYEEIRRLVASGNLTQVETAECFGVSKQHVNDIVHGPTWNANLRRKCLKP